jgi:hypothetical protein
MKVSDEEGHEFEDDIFDDSVLQALSILCPTGMVALTKHYILPYTLFFFSLQIIMHLRKS